MRENLCDTFGSYLLSTLLKENVADFFFQNVCAGTVPSIKYRCNRTSKLQLAMRLMPILYQNDKPHYFLQKFKCRTHYRIQEK